MEILTFEQRYEAICHEIEKRRFGWTISALDFDDVKQDILIHVYKKFGQFNPAKVKGNPETGFARWLNGLISSQISNHRRDHLGKFSRPCISNPKEPRGCPFNTGGDNCSQTPSGKQCSECPIYAAWEKRKIAQFQIKQPLAIDCHVQEVHNIQEEFMDVEGKKMIIDRMVMERLTRHECKIYRMLYIKGIPEKQVGKMLKLKKTGHTYAGYSSLYKLRKKVLKIAKEIIGTEGLAKDFVRVAPAPVQK